MNPRRTTIAWGGIDRPPIRNSSDCWPPTRLKIWFASIPNAFRWEINQPGLLEGELVARYIHRSMDRPEPRLWARPNRFSVRHWKSPKWIFTCIDRSDYLWRYVSPVEIDRVFYLVSVIPFAHLTPLLFFFLFLFARIYLGEFPHRRSISKWGTWILLRQVEQQQNWTWLEQNLSVKIFFQFVQVSVLKRGRLGETRQDNFWLFRCKLERTEIRRFPGKCESSILELCSVNTYRWSFWTISRLNRYLKATCLDYNARVSLSLDSRANGGKPEELSQAEKLSRWWQASWQITK